MFGGGQGVCTAKKPSAAARCEGRTASAVIAVTTAEPTTAAVCARRRRGVSGHEVYSDEKIAKS
jgi:hypothetical protein